MKNLWLVLILVFMFIIPSVILIFLGGNKEIDTTSVRVETSQDIVFLQKQVTLLQQRVSLLEQKNVKLTDEQTQMHKLLATNNLYMVASSKVLLIIIKDIKKLKSIYNSF